MKNLYLLIFIFLLSLPIKKLQAQNWWDWSNQMTESNGTPPVIDPQNNIIRVGNGTSNCSITKYNRRGETIWQKTYPGSGSCITNDEVGNIYTAGPVVDSGFHAANYSGIWDPQFSTVFKVPHTIAKLGPDGSVIWSLNSSKQVSVIHATANGELYVAGAFYRSSTILPMYDSVILGNISLSAAANGTYGSYYVFVGKIDSNGNTAWLKIFRRENPSGVYDQTATAGAIVSDNLGNVYVAGANRTGTLFADTIPLYAAYSSDFIMQLNAGTGAVKWAKILRYSDYTIHGNPLGTGAIQYAALNGDGSKGVLMTGYAATPYNIIFGDSLYRPTGKYICSFDISGNEKWMKFYNIGVSWPTGFYKRRDKYYVSGKADFSNEQDSLAVMDSSFNVIKKINTPGLLQFTVHDEDESIIAVRKPSAWNEKNHLCKVLQDYNKVSGYIFNDTNNNGIKDSTETGFANILVGSSENKSVTVSDKNGFYECYVDSGSHVIIPISGIRYHTYTPAAGYSVHFAGYGDIITGNNFACSPIPGIHDLTIATTPMGGTRPGMITYYSTSVKNKGTENATGTACIKLPAYTYYVADTSMSLPVFSSADSLAFSFSNLLPGEERKFTFKSLLSNLLTLGEILTVYSNTFPVVNDTVPGDNYDTLTQRVHGGFDPNDKLVFPDGNLSLVEKSKPLSYTIRFQNTGNDTAFNVHLVDTLSPKLDITTLELVSSSHTYTVKIEKGNVLHFYFDTINLVDSFQNEPLSHGYIRFKIRPVASVSVGDNILNNASIYFDFNKAVVTNTTSTRYFSGVLPVILKSFTASKNADAVQLYFTTETENLLQRFEIERSSDGNIFGKVTAINAKGYGSNYQYNDEQPFKSINFYRLKLFFTDGSFTYSTTQAVKMKTVKGTVVFPNPVGNTLFFTTAEPGQHSYKIYSADGRLHFTGYSSSIQTGSIIPINTSQLTPGNYYLEIVTTLGREIKQFVIK